MLSTDEAVDHASEGDLEGAVKIIRRPSASSDSGVDELVSVLIKEGGPSLLHRLRVRVKSEGEQANQKSRRIFNSLCKEPSSEHL